MLRRKKVIRTVVVLTTVIALAIAIPMWQAERRYQEDLQALRKLGAPTTMAELAKSVGAGGESDDAFEAALAIYQSIPGAEEYAGNMRGWLPTAGPKNTILAKQALAELVPLVYRVADSDRVDTRFLTESTENRMSRTGAVKMFAGMLLGESRLASHAGNHEAALNALRGLNNLSVRTSENPGLLDTYVAIAEQAMHFAGTHDYAIRFNEDQDALRALARYLEDRPGLKDFSISLKEGVAVLLSEIEKGGQLSKIIEEWATNTGTPLKAEEKIYNWFMDAKSVRSAAKRKLISRWRSAIEILNTQDEVWEKVSAIRKLDTDFEKDGSLSGKAARVLWAGFYDPYSSYVHALARGRVLRAATAVLLEKARTGKLPSSLPVLGEASIDPFTGKKLICMQLAPDAFKVYSVGKNLLDDGGHHQGFAGEDIVFEFVPSTKKIIVTRTP